MNLGDLSGKLYDQDATMAQAGIDFQKKIAALSDAFTRSLVPKLENWLQRDSARGTVTCALQPDEPGVLPGARLYISLVGGDNQVVVAPSADNHTGDVITLTGRIPQAIYYRDGNWYVENPNGSGTPASLTEETFERLLRRAFGEQI